MLSLSVQGKWKTSSNWNTLLDPLNGEPFIKVAEVDETGIQVCIMSSLQVLYFWKDHWLYMEAELKSLCFIMPFFFFLAPSLTCLLMFAYLASKFFPNCDWVMQPFVESLSKCPKHGLHNPFKAPERFALLIWSLCPFFFPLLIYIYLDILHWGYCDYLIPVFLKKTLQTIFCRYVLFGDISVKAAHMLSIPKVMYCKERDNNFL